MAYTALKLEFDVVFSSCQVSLKYLQCLWRGIINVVHLYLFSSHLMKEVSDMDRQTVGYGSIYDAPPTCYVGPVNQVNHTSWMAIVTFTGRNLYINSNFLIAFCVVTLLFRTFLLILSIGAIVIGLNQISSCFFFYKQPRDEKAIHI